MIETNRLKNHVKTDIIVSVKKRERNILSLNMPQKEILMAQNLETIKEKLKIEISDDTLIEILFDINRFFDKNFTKELKAAQKRQDKVLNSIERKILRTYYYYKRYDKPYESIIEGFPSIVFTSNDLNTVIQDTLNRLSQYNPEKILDSIKERYKNLISSNSASISHMHEWLEYYNKKRHSLSDYSMFLLRIDNEDFIKHDSSLEYIYELIRNTYSRLENYRHLIVYIDGQIKDKAGKDITWQIAYKTTIYAENFVQFKNKYNPCKKNEQIKNLDCWLNAKFGTELSLASEFYSAISTGYKYEDCYVSDNQQKIIICLKKISLDETPVPCPSCMTTIQTGNSYPEMFLRSYECKNSKCQDRSKSGRGKRFDEFSAYRSFKLEEHNKDNIISNELYSKWRRDVFSNELDQYEMIIKYYTWDNENILVFNTKLSKELYSRHTINYNEYNMHVNTLDCIDSYEHLPIVKLLNKVNALNCYKDTGITELKGDIVLLNGDSTKIIESITRGIIGCAITSPPYYNAREYSQWPTLIHYLIDMLINAKAVYNSMADGASYLYNIGDIVCEDNVFVRSNMSNRRLPLGFLSCMVFEIAGFRLNGNIIWDKGEVQSKRNSTVNLYSGYVKCINCYEHVLSFGKNSYKENKTKIVQITPVIKINSKGENRLGHTAPYPLELVSLIEPYIIPNKYILDPYLGSGTTLKWCLMNNKKGIGIEKDSQYYQLCVQNIYGKENLFDNQLSFYDILN